MKFVLKAFRDALIADTTLTTLVPAANIYAGLRGEKTPIPSIDVFRVSGASPEMYAGASIGGMTNAQDMFQISIFARSETDAWTIADRVMVIVLGDCATLNTAGIQNVSLTTIPPSLREANMSHIPVRVQCNYHFKIV